MPGSERLGSRCIPSVAASDDAIFVFGGFGENGSLSDITNAVYSYQAEDGEWQRHADAGGPTNESVPYGTARGSSFIAFDGFAHPDVVNNRFTIGLGWESIESPMTPLLGAYGVSFASVDGGFVAWGGQQPDALANGGSRYDVDTDAWTTIPGSETVRARAYAASAATSDYVFVFGGEVSDEPEGLMASVDGGPLRYVGYDTSTGAVYEVSTGEWQEITQEGAPPPASFGRRAAVASPDGKFLVVEPSCRYAALYDHTLREWTDVALGGDNWCTVIDTPAGTLLASDAGVHAFDWETMQLTLSAAAPPGRGSAEVVWWSESLVSVGACNRAGDRAAETGGAWRLALPN